MRIGHLTFSYQPITGGGDVYLQSLLGVLARAGHSQRVYQRASTAATEEIRPVPNPLGRFPAAFWTQALFLPTQRGELAKEDLLICHYPVYLLAAAMALPRGPRLLGLSHGVTWDDHPGLRSAVKRAVAARAFRRAHAFVANDTHFLREMGMAVWPRQNLFERLGDHAWFIPNCVDAAAFSRADPWPDLARLNPILVPRNLYFNRGIHLAIEAFATVARERSDTTLVIVGAESQPRYAKYCRQLVAEFALGERVRFWGPAPHDQMVHVYSSGRLTLIPSVCGEGTSLAALESMAAGTPVVSTNVAGLADLPTLHAAPQPAPFAAQILCGLEQRDELAAEQLRAVREVYSLANWESAWLAAVDDATRPA